MVILFCTNTFESSGHGPSKFAKFIFELNELNDVEVHILTEDMEKSQTNLHKVNVRNGIVASYVGMITRIRDYTKAIEFFIKQNGKPDIIIFNNAIIGLKTFRRIDIPSIGMINDYSSILYMRIFPLFSKKYIRHKVFNFFEKMACKYADRIIVNSISLKKDILANYNIEDAKLRILYKSIETNLKQSSKTFNNSNKIRILFVKTNWQMGGLEDLISAANLLNIKNEIVIIGPMKSQDKLFSKLNSSANTSLNFLGPCTQEEVFNQMRLADIFCTPSRLEALGVANMEALILKLPVVYTNVGGIPEVMNYGNNGFVADAENPLSLSKALTKCINNEYERNEKVQEGYSFVTNNFSKKIMLNKFINICSEVINE